MRKSRCPRRCETGKTSVNIGVGGSNSTSVLQDWGRRDRRPSPRRTSSLSTPRRPSILGSGVLVSWSGLRTTPLVGGQTFSRDPRFHSDDSDPDVVSLLVCLFIFRNNKGDSLITVPYLPGVWGVGTPSDCLVTTCSVPGEVKPDLKVGDFGSEFDFTRQDQESLCRWTRSGSLGSEVSRTPGPDPRWCRPVPSRDRWSMRSPRPGVGSSGECVSLPTLSRRANPHGLPGLSRRPSPGLLGTDLTEFDSAQAPRSRGGFLV